MKSTPAITIAERNLLLRDLIVWLILTVGMASFIIYLLTGILTSNTVKEEVWTYMFAFAMVLIVFLFKTVKLFLDYSSKEIDEGQSEITDMGRELSSSYNRYIRLSVYGKRKIKIQYADLDKMRKGDLIKYRIAPKTRILLSFEIVK